MRIPAAASPLQRVEALQQRGRGARTASAVRLERLVDDVALRRQQVERRARRARSSSRCAACACLGAERLGREGGGRVRVRERQMHLRGPPAERRRARRYQCSSAAKNGGGDCAAGTGGFERRVQPLRAADARATALVVAAQLVDREVPARSLMLDDALHDGERARLDVRAVMVLSAPASAGVRVKPAPGQVAPASRTRDSARLDAPEQLQHVAIVDEQRRCCSDRPRRAPTRRFGQPRSSTAAVEHATQAADVPVGNLARAARSAPAAGCTCRRRRSRRRWRPCARR